MTAGTGSDAEVAEVSASAEVAEAEQRLLVTLGAWSTWSLLLGFLAWRIGRREDAPSLRAAGRTTVGWAVADAGVVGWGAWRARSRAGADPGARARRTARLTGINALLDVGYVAGGAVLAGSPRRRGVGLATVVQGVALLYLDSRYCLEFLALARDHGPGTSPGPLDSARARDRRRPARGGGDGRRGNDSIVVRNVP